MQVATCTRCTALVCDCDCDWRLLPSVGCAVACPRSISAAALLAPWCERQLAPRIQSLLTSCAPPTPTHPTQTSSTPSVGGTGHLVASHVAHRWLSASGETHLRCAVCGPARRGSQMTPGACVPYWCVHGGAATAAAWQRRGARRARRRRAARNFTRRHKVHNGCGCGCAVVVRRAGVARVGAAPARRRPAGVGVGLWEWGACGSARARPLLLPFRTSRLSCLAWHRQRQRRRQEGRQRGW